MMRITSHPAFAAALVGIGLFACASAGPASAADKNWTPPAHKIYAQALSDQTMREHPELQSVTFHGIPPGITTKTYTMYAGSYPERIGNADDPDDIDVITKGITIIDPRWHRPNDTVKRFVVQMPLRDASGENIGLIVYAFKNATPHKDDERTFTAAAMDMRDKLEAQIPNYAALFAPAK